MVFKELIYGKYSVTKIKLKDVTNVTIKNHFGNAFGNTLKLDIPMLI